MTIFNRAIDKTLWKYYLFIFLKDFIFISAVLIPFFTKWGGISLFQAQILQSWFMLWLFFLEVPTGAVADKIGRKHSMAVGAIVVAIAVVIYGSIPRFEIFLLGEFLFAMGVAFMSGADEALLYDTLKEAGREKESQKIFGLANSINLLGIMIAAPIGSVIASVYGLNAPMQFSAIPLLLAAIVAWTIKEPKIHDAQSEKRRYLEVVKKGFTHLFYHKTLRLLTLDAIIVSASAYFVIWFYQPLFLKIGIPIYYFGFAHAFLVGSEILVSSNFTFFEKIFGSAKSFIRSSAMIVIFSFLLVAIFPNIITILILLILGGGFGLTRLTLMTSYMNKFIPSPERATILSSISMFRRFLLVFLNPIIGFTADRSLTLALLLVGLFPLIIFLFSPVEKEVSEK